MTSTTRSPETMNGRLASASQSGKSFNNSPSIYAISLLFGRLVILAAHSRLEYLDPLPELFLTQQCSSAHLESIWIVRCAFQFLFVRYQSMPFSDFG